MKVNMRRLEIILLLIVTFLVIFMLCMMFLPHRLYADEIHGHLWLGYLAEDGDYSADLLLLANGGYFILLDRWWHEPKPDQWAVGYIEFHFVPYADTNMNLQWKFTLNGIVRFY